MIKFYIETGKVTDPNAHETPCNVGDVEWQISDGPSGDRSISYDFVGSLANALNEVKAMHPNASFHIPPKKALKETS